MHRHGIDQNVFVLYVRIVFGDLVRDFSPQARRRHDVGFIYRGDLFAALARQLERRAHEARHLTLSVENRVHGLTSSSAGSALTGPAVVDPAGQLAHHHQVHSL